MAMQPAGFLQEANGTYSSMRLMSVLALGAAVVFGVLTVLHPSSEIGLYLTGLFLLAAFAPKVLQKALEQQLSLPTKDETHGPP